MAKEEKKMLSLSPEHREALRELGARPEFKALEKLLKIEQNNIAVIDWFRTRSSDPDIVRKKAYSEGRFDETKAILNIFERVKKK